MPLLSIRLAGVWSVATAALWGSAAVRAADDEAVELAKGLRARRYFDLADAHCARGLTRADLEPAEEAALALEQIQARTDRALAAPFDGRAPLFQSATDAAQEFLQRRPNHVRRVLVEVQEALVHLAHGSLLQREIEADLIAPGQRDLALSELRLAGSQCDAIDRRIESEIPARRAARDDGGLSADELLVLRIHLRFQQSLTYLHRALLYGPEEETDRVDALAQVLVQLDQVQRTIGRDHPLYWQATAVRLDVLRRLGQLDEARRQLRELLGPDEPIVPPDARLPLRAVAVESALDAGDNGEASQWVRGAGEWESSAPPEWWWAVLRWLNAAAGDPAVSESDRKLSQQQALQLAERIAQIHGGYWGRRAHLLIVQSAGANASPDSPGVLLRLAAEAERQQDWDDAIAAYDRCADAAATIGDDASALRAAARAAWLVQEQGRHAEASARFAQAAETFALAAEAPDLFLSACWNLAQTLGDDPRIWQEYAGQLQSGIARWPDAPAANQLRIWHARALARQSQWEAACESALQVRSDSPLLAQALQEFGRYAGAWLAQTKPDDHPSSVTIENWIADITARAFPGGTTPSGSSWTEAHRQALIVLAQLQWRGPSPPAPDLATRLQAAIDAARDAAGVSDEWKSTATAWLVLGLARDPGRRDDARQFLTQSRSSAALTIVRDGCLAVIQAAPQSPPEPIWSELILRASAQAAEVATFSAEELIDWGLAEADALKRLDRAAEGVEKLRDLSARYPSDGRVQLALARALSDRLVGGGQDTRGALDESLAAWRKLSQRFKPYSDLWWESKYHIARIMILGGQISEARKLLEYHRLTPPGWTQSAWRAPLDSLLDQCNERK